MYRTYIYEHRISSLVARDRRHMISISSGLLLLEYTHIHSTHTQSKTEHPVLLGHYTHSPIQSNPVQSSPKQNTQLVPQICCLHMAPCAHKTCTFQLDQNVVLCSINCSFSASYTHFRAVSPLESSCTIALAPWQSSCTIAPAPWNGTCFMVRISQSCSPVQGRRDLCR